MNKMFPSITVVPIEDAFSRNTGLGTNSLLTMHKNIVFVNNFGTKYWQDTKFYVHFKQCSVGTRQLRISRKLLI